MTPGVVDPLQPVHVDKGNDQPPGAPSGAVDLLGKPLHSGATPPDVGQLIDVRGRPILRGLGTFAHRNAAVICRQHALLNSRLPLSGSIGAIVRSAGTFVNRPSPIACYFERWFPAR